jgi:hypothetical protein
MCCWESVAHACNPSLEAEIGYQFEASPGK